MANRWSLRASNRASCWSGALAAVFLSVADPATLPGTCPLETLPQRADGIGVPLGSVSISASGRFVAFASKGQLIAADTNGRSDIYVYDLTTGRITIESLLPNGTSSNGDSFRPSISADGRFVVFEASGQLAGGSAAVAQVVLRDRQLAVTSVLSRGRTGALGNQSSGHPVISGDGGIVAFQSGATNLLPSGEASLPTIDVYAMVPASGEIWPMSRVSRASDGKAGDNFSPAVSSDGLHLAFTFKESADDIVAFGPARPGTVALRDVGPAKTEVRVSAIRRGTIASVGRRSDGGPANGRSYLPAISGDGRYVAFVSEATNLAAADTNGAADVFLHDLLSGSTDLVSRSRRGRTGNGASSYPALSLGARFIAFQSEAADLVCASRCSPRDRDVNLTSDVFVFDRESDTMTRISEDTAGPWLEPSGAPAVDGMGAVLAFSSRRPIDARDGSSDFDLFVRRCSPSRPAAHRLDGELASALAVR